MISPLNLNATELITHEVAFEIKDQGSNTNDLTFKHLNHDNPASFIFFFKGSIIIRSTFKRQVWQKIPCYVPPNSHNHELYRQTYVKSKGFFFFQNNLNWKPIIVIIPFMLTD